MNKEVATAKPDDQLVVAAKTMLERKIGCVVVVEREKIVGIVTESDLVKCAASGHDPNRTLVKDIMRSPAVTCTPQAPWKRPTHTCEKTTYVICQSSTKTARSSAS